MVLLEAKAQDPQDEKLAKTHVKPIGKRLDEVINYLQSTSYSGNFSFCGFFKGRAHLFIVLAFFCAFGFYISTLIKSYPEYNNPIGNLYIELGYDPANFFIKLSLLLTFTIILIISTAIIYAAITFGSPKKNSCVQNQKIAEHNKLDFWVKLICDIKRYTFIILFYSVIFYDIAYLILTYLEGLKFLIVIISVIFQVVIIYKIIDESTEQDIYFYASKFLVVLFSLILIYAYLSNPNNTTFIIFFFPICLILALFLSFLFEFMFIFSNIFNILQDKPISLEQRTTNHQKSKFAPANAALTVASIIVLIFIFVGLSASFGYKVQISQNDFIDGTWQTKDKSYTYSFYNDLTCRIDCNTTIKNGNWEKIDAQHYKITFSNSYYNETPITLKMENNLLKSEYGNVTLIKIK